LAALESDLLVCYQIGLNKDFARTCVTGMAITEFIKEILLSVKSMSALTIKNAFTTLRDSIHNTSLSSIPMNGPNKLECLSLASLSIVV
jgi:hypothetical protein